MIRSDDADRRVASGDHPPKERAMNPGEYFLEDGEIEANAGRDARTLLVRNVGDRPIQMGSHFHFFEANRALVFDRRSAFGMRLNVPSGTAVRFEPGEEKEVRLTAYGGRRIAWGHNGLTNGPLDDPATLEAAMARLSEKHFVSEPSADAETTEKETP
jgi:urease beta subunit